MSPLTAGSRGPCHQRSEVMGARVRNPRREATELLPEGSEARVLEPSPPANTDPDWFADDPTDPSDAKGSVVTPIPGEGTTWNELATERPSLAEFAAENWLDAGRRRLVSLPDGYEMTRRSLHQIAFYSVAPKRYAATGKLGLRFVFRGFGTPFFGADEQLRVEAGRLIYQTADDVRSTTPSTLEEACEFSGIRYQEVWFPNFHDPPPAIGPTARLDIGSEAARSIGEWFGFATHALERVRRTTGAEQVGRVQLWPEHFDPAIEMGSSEKGQRGSYGASPGDEDHPEPYLYVAAWGDVDRNDAYWNDSSFNGASLSYDEILKSTDQLDAALHFYHDGFRRLTATTR